MEYPLTEEQKETIKQFENKSNAKCLIQRYCFSDPLECEVVVGWKQLIENQHYGDFLAIPEDSFNNETLAEILNKFLLPQITMIHNRIAFRMGVDRWLYGRQSMERISQFFIES